MHWLEHVEGIVLILAPFVGLVALILEFNPTNLLLFTIRMLLWNHANGAL